MKCKTCGAEMIPRKTNKQARPGQSQWFYGCINYSITGCRYTVNCHVGRKARQQAVLFNEGRVAAARAERDKKLAAEKQHKQRVWGNVNRFPSVDEKMILPPIRYGEFEVIE